MTRVTELRAREQLPAEFHAAYDDVVSNYNGRVVGPFRVLFHSPELARRVCSIGAVLRMASPLPVGMRELAIIASAREWDCLYEWFAHEPGALRAGVGKTSIDAVRHNKALTGLPDEDAEVVQFVRDLLRLNRVAEHVFNKVLARYGVQATVELTATIGFYRIFACVMNACEVPADTPIDFPVGPGNRPRQAEALAQHPYHGASARIPLLALAQDLNASQRAAFDEIAASRGGRVAGPFLALLHSPEIARCAASAGNYVCLQSLLPADVRELAILTTARANDCAYQWVGHETLARQAGVRERAIAAIEDGQGIENLPAAEAEIIQFIQELLATNRVSEARFQAALGRFGVQGLVELAATAGYYSMLACVLNAFEIQPG